MRKILIVLIALHSCFYSISSANAVTPGTSCTKAGATSTQNGKKFTCIKLGSKLYWDNGVTVKTATSSTNKKDAECKESIAGKISINGKTRCVMVDDLSETGSGEYQQLFEYRPIKEIPESTLCRHEDQFWSNQTWYDGIWKCGYYVEGEWSKWGWHKSQSQFPNAISTNYVTDKSKIASSPSKNTNVTKNCSPSTSRVRASYGSVSMEGFNVSAYVFENMSDCNISISASVRFLCPNGGVLSESRAIFTTGIFPLSPKQKLGITSLLVPRYFPQALQQCYQLTGYRSNLVFFSNFSNPDPQVLVLTSQP